MRDGRVRFEKRSGAAHPGGPVYRVWHNGELVGFVKRRGSEWTAHPKGQPVVGVGESGVGTPSRFRLRREAGEVVVSRAAEAVADVCGELAAHDRED